MRYLLLSVISCWISSRGVEAAPAYPLAEPYEQPDGTQTPPLYINGDEEYTWLSDEKGYTVIEDEHDWYVYAKKVDGVLVSTGVKVGYKNPKKLGLVPGLQDDEQMLFSANAEEHAEHRRGLNNVPEQAICNFMGTKESPCKLKGLVVLVRFRDHAKRNLPSRADYDILFNENGPDKSVAPTGSVASVFLANSYDSFEYSSDISPWIQIDMDEKTASGPGKYGRNTRNTKAAWREALTKLEKQGSMTYSDYATEGVFNSMLFMHSGAASEFGKTDCETGAKNKFRIWSHAVGGGLGYESSGGVRVGRFYVASGVYGVCYADKATKRWAIARIGVIAHEFSHFLGLPDLYDGKTVASSIGKKAGNGVGTFDMMSNMWGWYKKHFQLLPPLMLSWTKKQLNWVDVMHINGNFEYDMLPSYESNVVLMVDHNMVEGEYIMCEYRAPGKFDIDLKHHKGRTKDRSGAACVHVDETGNVCTGVKRRGGRVGCSHTSNGVPRNGKAPIHYEVALIEGDTNWDLENGRNKGDKNDLLMDMTGMNPKRAKKIDNDGVVLSDAKETRKPEPNTKGYAKDASGTEYHTGISLTFGTYQPKLNIKIELEGAGPHVPEVKAAAADACAKKTEIDQTDMTKDNQQDCMADVKVACGVDVKEKIKYVGVGNNKTKEKKKNCKWFGKNQKKFCNLLDQSGNHDVDGLKPRIWQICPKTCSDYSGCPASSA